MLSTPALPRRAVVSNGAPQSSDNGATLVEVTGSNEDLGDHTFEGTQSLSTNPNISTKTVLGKSDVDAFSEHKETKKVGSSNSDSERNEDEDHRPSKKSSRSKQNHHSHTSTKSRKRKAAMSAAPPTTKKQKVNSPTSTRQRKATGKPRFKTVKERFQAASAADTRPLPWGEPEVWAEVLFPCRWMSTVKAKTSSDPP